MNSHDNSNSNKHSPRFLPHSSHRTQPTMGCKQSTLRTTSPVAQQQQSEATPAPVAVAAVQPTVKQAEASPSARCASEQRPIDASPKQEEAQVMEPTVEDILAQIELQQPAASSPRVESKAASPARLGERAPSVLNVAAASSASPKASATAAAVSFSDFLAQQENASANNKAEKQPRKVLFDAETMRKSAPKSAAPVQTKLTKKQQDLIKKNHVSTGRRGPVASRFEKGSRSQMQTDVYLQMANAFERLLTNAETINAHLDTR